MRVLQIGTGSGYLAALIAELIGVTGHVVSIEIDPEVSAATRANLERTGYGHVECVVADGLHGHAPGGPYDRIVATAACFDVPSAWVEQLAPSGFMTLPLSLTQRASLYPIVWLQKAPRGLVGGVAPGLPGVGFVPLYGPAVAHSVLYDTEIGKIETAVGMHLRGLIGNRQPDHGLWLTGLLETATAVLSDWENHQRWDPRSISSRALTLWREANQPGLSSFVFHVGDEPIGPSGHRWKYDEHGRRLTVGVGETGIGRRGRTSSWRFL
jgi:SAM-dependent methyltransferase